MAEERPPLTRKRVFVALAFGMSCWVAYVGQLPAGRAVTSRLQSRSPAVGKKWLVPGVAIALMPIDAGTFLMGSASAKAYQDKETPQHRVTLSKPFWMGKYEVTQREYRAVMGENPSRWQDPNRAVHRVSWEKASEFCRRLTARQSAAGRLPEGYAYRLPTEAEWEYCCRAGSAKAFCFGDDPKDLGIYTYYEKNLAGSKCLEVGRKKANAFGLHDMHGGVQEWCLDRYGKYTRRSVVDPVGPQSGTHRVIRGGWIGSRAECCRCAYRSSCRPTIAGLFWGFRVALGPYTARHRAAAEPAVPTKKGGPGQSGARVPSAAGSAGSVGTHQ